MYPQAPVESRPKPPRGTRPVNRTCLVSRRSSPYALGHSYASGPDSWCTASNPELLMPVPLRSKPTRSGMALPLLATSTPHPVPDLIARPLCCPGSSPGGNSSVRVGTARSNVQPLRPSHEVLAGCSSPTTPRATWATVILPSIPSERGNWHRELPPSRLAYGQDIKTPTSKHQTPNPLKLHQLPPQSLRTRCAPTGRTAYTGYCLRRISKI